MSSLYTGVAIRNISKTSLKNIKIPIPSLERQEEIVKYCESNDKLIKQLEKDIEENKKQAQLFMSNVIKSNVLMIDEDDNVHDNDHDSLNDNDSGDSDSDDNNTDFNHIEQGQEEETTHPEVQEQTQDEPHEQPKDKVLKKIIKKSKKKMVIISKDKKK